MTPERARRLYGVLLRLAPPRLRDRYADEMEELFADELLRARERGGSTIGVVARATADLLRARFARRPPRTPLTVPIDERTDVMIGSDLRYALRSLSRQKFGTALVVAMLSLGIAANVAVFSLVDGLFLRPFPFPQPDRLVYFNETAPRWNLEIVGINYPDFVAWRQGQHAFEAIGLYDPSTFNLYADGHADRIRGLRVTYDFAAALGVKPILGRTFTPEEDKPKGPPVVIISEGLWRERFGADQNVLGKTLRINSVPHTIIGVLPKNADFPDEARVWVPLAGDPTPPGGSYAYEGIGRLKPGVTPDEGNRDLLRAHQPIFDKYDKEKTVSPFVRSLREQFVRDVTTIARTLLSAVAVLLLVACANVASIMLARALARRREMGIRLALGASRTRLLRQLFIENLILGAIGCAIGLAAGRWAVNLLVANVPDEVPHWASFGLSWRVVLFAVGTMLATVVLFGWAPGLHAVRGDLRSAVHDVSSGTTASPRGRRTLWILVGAEFAMAALLLTCGGLLFRAFDRVRHVDPGFRTDHLLTFQLALPEAAYPTREKRLVFWDALDARLNALPGVESAGLITCAPFGCHWGTFFKMEGEAPPPPGSSRPVTLYRYATADYFRTAGIRLKEGRFFDDRDDRDGHTGPKDADKPPQVAIVNESFARTFWPDGRSPVGRRISFNNDRPEWITVVGLVADVKHYGLERPMRPGLYFPLPSRAVDTMTVVLRTRTEPAAIVPSVRAALHDADPELPLFRPRSMDESIRRSLGVRAVYSWMLGVFAVLALVLAVGGAYGVATYLVTQRTREIGIRVALGAQTTDILRSVVGRGLAVVTIGVAAGVLASFGAAQKISSLLFGVSPHDATILTAVVGILVATALVANTLPARRAARIDPMRSLRID